MSAVNGEERQRDTVNALNGKCFVQFWFGVCARADSLDLEFRRNEWEAMQLILLLSQLKIKEIRFANKWQSN